MNFTTLFFRHSIYLIFTFILLDISLVFGQKEVPEFTIDSTTNLITYSEVVYVDSVSKAELFDRAKEWFAKTYKSANDVLQMEDKESGKMIGKAKKQVFHRGLGADWPSGYINYTISIYFREGRYRYEITNFYHTGQIVQGGAIQDYGSCDDMRKPDGATERKLFPYYLQQLDNNIKNLISDLKSVMAAKIQHKGKDDW